MAYTERTVLCLAAAVRIILIIYGTVQDQYMKVKYTDVDYNVYTDAAREVADGNSPYDRTTYRYTPILAYMMLPNLFVHECFGKVLFGACDLLIGHLLFAILRKRGLSEQSAIRYTSVWLFHPFSINISTRGNADAIVAFLVILSIYLLMHKKHVLSALAYGFAVHFKIYPIVYALAFLVLLDKDFRGTTSPKKSNDQPVLRQILGLVTWDRVSFGAISGGLFLALIAVFYYTYGYEFLYETYLYHLTRTDNRHNFSVYFYDLYLRYNTPSGLSVGLLTFLPQVASLLTISFCFGRDISFALFALTMVFVIFNKVCTAQYFLWYTVFLPLILPRTTLQLRWKGVGMILTWLAGQLHWLYWAYYLEMEGENTFFPLWVAGLLFFIANVGVLATVMSHHQVVPLFDNGGITSLDKMKQE